MPETRTGDRLDARYGRRERSRRSRVVPVVVAAVLGAVAIVAWGVWTGIGGIGSSTELQTLGFESVDDRTISVRWSVTGDAGATLICSVQAQAEDRSIVGLAVVEVPPGATERSGTTEVRIVRESVAGLLSECRRA